MTSPKDYPARNLSGVTLKNGWKITDKVCYDDTHTGGRYSICYNIDREGKTYFLKAYDLLAYIQGDDNHEKRFEALDKMTSQFKYETELSKFCQNSRLDKIVSIIDSGIHASTDGTMVPYLIFERADCDVRKFLSINSMIENTWKLKSLHEIATGLKQLHGVRVYHQDIKPSNILTYNRESRITDLGRAVWKEHYCPFVNELYIGDKTYMAPEVAYRHHFEDDVEKMLLTEMYLFGSLVCYYFTSTPYNGLLYSQLPQELHHANSGMTYSEVLQPLTEAHAKVISSLRELITVDNHKIKDELIDILDQLCHPDFKKRIHPKISPNASVSLKYGMERIVSRLNKLHLISRYSLTHS